MLDENKEVIEEIREKVEIVLDERRLNLIEEHNILDLEHANQLNEIVLDKYQSY